MSLAVNQPSVVAGEVSPGLYGRTDLQKYKAGSSTLRNMWVTCRGGANSRAGTKFCGQSKQLGSEDAPQLIPFQFNVEQGIAIEAGNQYFRFIEDGAYVTEDGFTLSAATNASPGVFTSATSGFSVNDWVFFSGVEGMTEVNGNTYIVGTTPTANTFTLKNTLDLTTISTAAFGVFVTSGTVARIYTLTTPYADDDVPMLKWSQSADVMTLTHNDYAPYDLARIDEADWTLTKTTFSTSVSPPASAVATASVTTASYTTYQYKVTAIDTDTGEESIASPIATVTNSVNIGQTLGTINLTWAAVTGAEQYNIYKGPPTYLSPVPVGALFGYAGTSFGLAFTDNNIIQDLSTPPPTHQNPFATASIIAVNRGAVGTSYTASNPPSVVITGVGTGGSITPVPVSGGIYSYIINSGGEGWTSGTTIAISGGAGSGATATVSIGPTTGTYPACSAYFQDRRFYANTTNNPDTYFASQPGAFTNMDSSIPTVGSDAIIGTPWAEQVNGIQWMVPMPGGLVILTGLGAWQLSGGQPGTAVTPDNQVATAQAYNGCSPLIKPIVINYDILYVQSKGSIVRDLAYNFFVNIYTGTDLTILSNHLFDNNTLLRWDWSNSPNKLLWAVRNDGTMLCLTFIKEQDVYAWSRHDTNGLFESVCCISEPPVDATYVVVKRLINGTWAHYIERMDDRLWTNIEDAWCVDSGLSYPMEEPDATLTASSATGDGKITEFNIIAGGSGYVAPVGTIVDTDGGTGSGATVNFTVAAGTITAAVPGATGSGYSHPVLEIYDSAGVGATVQPIVTNLVTLTASSAVFAAGNVGDIVRLGGGKAEITTYSSTTVVTANILIPIVQTIPNDPNNTPIPATSGNWTLSTPTDTVSGLGHLEGMDVVALADGGVVLNLTVEDGAVTLPAEASAIVVGLPFTAQLQTLYFDADSDSAMQTRRKNIYQVGLRVEASRAPEVGANQPNQASTPGGGTPVWSNMTQVQSRSPLAHAGQPEPLFTGDYFLGISSEWDEKGMVAIQQSAPVPLGLLSLTPLVEIGDTPG